MALKVKLVRGMIHAVDYLIEWSETSEEFKPFGRRQARKAAKAANASKAKA